MTIKELAVLAGVSIGTIDRVLHNRGRVAPETAARVRSLIERTSFRPNLLASRLSSARVYAFAALLPRPDQDGGYWKLCLAGIRKAAAELAPYNVRVHVATFDRYSPHAFARAGHRALGCDGLLAAPVLVGAAERFLASLEADFPLVLFDSDLPGRPRLSYIGQDAYQSGVLAARLAGLLSPLPFAVVRPVPADFHIAERVRGFLDRCAHAPAILDQKNADDPLEAGRLMSLVRGTRCGGFFVTNASAHLFAPRSGGSTDRRTDHQPAARRRPERGAKRAAGGSTDSRLSVVGYDLIPPNIAALERGGIDFIISQRPEVQGYEGIYQLYRRLALKETVKTELIMPLDIYTRENVAFHTYH